MKCPMCLGKGYATDEDIKEYPHRCQNCNDKGFYAVDWQKVRCEVCNGSGKKPMTEQEYIQTCNTEQLAKVLLSFCQYPCEICKIECNDGGACTYNKALNTIVEWLKQPYSGE